jgi:hypothetical protein
MGKGVYGLLFAMALGLVVGISRYENAQPQHLEAQKKLKTPRLVHIRVEGESHLVPEDKIFRENGSLCARLPNGYTASGFEYVLPKESSMNPGNSPAYRVGADLTSKVSTN